jgi:hypothetical protein
MHLPKNFVGQTHEIEDLNQFQQYDGVYVQ